MRASWAAWLFRSTTRWLAYNTSAVSTRPWLLNLFILNNNSIRSSAWFSYTRRSTFTWLTYNFYLFNSWFNRDLLNNASDVTTWGRTPYLRRGSAGLLVLYDDVVLWTDEFNKVIGNTFQILDPITSGKIIEADTSDVNRGDSINFSTTVVFGGVLDIEGFLTTLLRDTVDKITFIEAAILTCTNLTQNLDELIKNSQGEVWHSYYYISRIIFLRRVKYNIFQPL